MSQLIAAASAPLAAELVRHFFDRQFASSKVEEAASIGQIRSRMERAAGSLRDNDSLYQFFLDQLARHARNLASSVADHTMLTLEKAWTCLRRLRAMNKILKGAGRGILAIPLA